MLEVSSAHAAYFRRLTLAEDRKRELAEIARVSIDEAEALEAADEEPLEDYLAAYFAEA